MYAPDGVTTSAEFAIPDTMKAWILGDPGELKLTRKPVPVPGPAHVLIRIDAVSICASDLDVLYHGWPALIEGGKPFNRNFTPGHEYMGTVVALGPSVDEYAIGQRVAVEIHAGCGQCKRCRQGMYTSCLNYGLNYGSHNKGHRANGFTTDGGFCEYQVNHINTLAALNDDISDEIGTLVVTAGTATYALTEIGGLIAGESLVVTGDGAIGLLVAAVGKALGASPVILTGMLANRLEIGRAMGADHTINVGNEDPIAAVRRIVGNVGPDYVVECSGAPNAAEQAVTMVSRGGRVCLVALPPGESSKCDVGRLAKDNISLIGIRGEGRRSVQRACSLMREKRINAGPLHTHTFALDDLPTAMRYAGEKLDGAIKVVVKARGVAAHKVAAE